MPARQRVGRHTLAYSGSEVVRWLARQVVKFLRADPCCSKVNCIYVGSTDISSEVPAGARGDWLTHSQFFDP